MTSVIRAATPEDAPFLSWAMLTAYRSHTDTCVPEVYLGARKGEAMAFLEALTITATVHHGHYSAFSILDVDGVPAASMSGYFEDEMPFPALLEGIDSREQVARHVGR